MHTGVHTPGAPLLTPAPSCSAHTAHVSVPITSPGATALSGASLLPLQMSAVLTSVVGPRTTGDCRFTFLFLSGLRGSRQVGGYRRTVKGALKKRTEEEGSTTVAQAQPPQAQHPRTHTKAADRWASTPTPSPCLPVSTTEFPLPALDLQIVRHPFNPSAPYLLCLQPLSLSWLLALASSVFNASLS